MNTIQIMVLRDWRIAVRHRESDADHIPLRRNRVGFCIIDCGKKLSRCMVAVSLRYPPVFNRIPLLNVE